MPNMSHCRFHNTVQDLQDCYDHIDGELSDSESRARDRLLLLINKIAADYSGEIEALLEARAARNLKRLA